MRRSPQSSPNSLLLAEFVSERTCNAAKSPSARCWHIAPDCPLTKNFSCAQRLAMNFCAQPSPLNLSPCPARMRSNSDIGFIILGVALERLADEPLDAFCQREIFGPLAMAHTTFNPAKALRESIPPTADDRTFRHRIIQGEVQDENASVLGGVAGHAGLFSTAEDLARFAHAMLNGGRPICRQSTVDLFTLESAPVVHLGLSGGIHRLRHRSLVSIFLCALLGTSATQVRRSGLTPSASFRSRC